MKTFIIVWAGICDEKYTRDFHFKSLKRIYSMDTPRQLTDDIVGMPH